MSTVFVSHCSNDRSFVESDVIAPLESSGLRTWYSRDEILAADEWQESIRKGIQECDWFLVVLSAASVKSKWVRAEVALAFEQFVEGRIVPVMFEECDPALCHIQLRLLQYIDFRSDAIESRVGQCRPAI
jgi:hypothetical protein